MSNFGAPGAIFWLFCQLQVMHHHLVLGLPLCEQAVGGRHPLNHCLLGLSKQVANIRLLSLQCGMHHHHHQKADHQMLHHHHHHAPRLSMLSCPDFQLKIQTRFPPPPLSSPFYHHRVCMLEGKKTHLNELLLFCKQGGLEGLQTLGGGSVRVHHQAQVLQGKDCKFFLVRLACR